MEFVLTANSPGEVSTWLAPVVRALREKTPGARISVFLVPCAFATGAEKAVVAAMPGVDRAFGPGEYWRHALAVPAVRGFEREGAVLFLGGDPVHALWLGRRLGLPALAYMERGSRWGRHFAEVFVPNEGAREKLLRRGADPQRVRVVGDLMLDAVRPSRSPEAVRAELGLDPSRPVVAVFPGSRRFELEQAMPFLLRAAEILWEGRRELQFVMSLAPFVSPLDLDGKPVAALGGTPVTLEPDGNRWRAVTGRGLVVPALRGAPYDIMQVADLALTVPGSNTAEMAAMGLPMVVALPLNLAESIPLPGLAQYVERVPVVGKRWKRAIVHRLSARTPLVALPNRKAGRAIVPEVRGILRPEDVALEAERLLADAKARSAMAAALREVMGPPGAARRIAERLYQVAAGPSEAIGRKGDDQDEREAQGGLQPGEVP